jgi:cytochrome c-type biogenesis protein CcmH/NrfG
MHHVGEDARVLRPERKVVEPRVARASLRRRPCLPLLIASLVVIAVTFDGLQQRTSASSRVNRLDRAPLSELLRRLNDSPNDFHLHANLGDRYFRKNNLRKAMQHYKAAEKLADFAEE